MIKIDKEEYKKFSPSVNNESLRLLEAEIWDYYKYGGKYTLSTIVLVSYYGVRLPLIFVRKI